jgi:tetratricopeptide (TPR) repeat protein
MEPVNLDTLFQEGEEHRRKGRYLEAITAYRQILIQAPETPPILRRLGDCLIKKGVPREAIAYLHDAIRLDPSDPGQFHILAIAQRKVGDLDRALVAYERASSLAPESVTYWVDLGWCLSDLGAMNKDRSLQEKAKTAFEKARELNPGDPGVLEGLASLHKDLNEFDQALEVIEQALAIDPYDLDRLELKERILRHKA